MLTIDMLGNVNYLVVLDGVNTSYIGVAPFIDRRVVHVVEQL